MTFCAQGKKYVVKYRSVGSKSLKIIKYRTSEDLEPEPDPKPEPNPAPGGNLITDPPDTAPQHCYNESEKT
jgi:hypothetical protein